MDSIRYENCYAASEVSKQMVPSDWRNVEWTNKMKVYLNSDQAVTAKDLLSMFSPFGCVISVQTTVKNNHRYGMVHYHSADEAAVALREMKRRTKVFFVAQVGIREVGEGRKDKRSERPDRPPPGSCSYRPLYRRPILWEPLFPAYRRTVSIEIDNLPRSWYERELLLSLLPPTTIDVKTEAPRSAAFHTKEDIGSRHRALLSVTCDLCMLLHIQINTKAARTQLH
ncbi:uncharacterized protein LOC116309247 isoform X2 [Oreochromis aureus]|uniref:uncharacterized protein LOC116309247 isoform X2 n=1 Tax=Oreochromis aureus TaxID=47969 RepID=UPI001954BE92|nr:uncharacterized protein LOC116309247 isoform X2 [Oreochromis aureus]